MSHCLIFGHGVEFKDTYQFHVENFHYDVLCLSHVKLPWCPAENVLRNISASADTFLGPTTLIITRVCGRYYVPSICLKSALCNSNKLLSQMVSKSACYAGWHIPCFCILSLFNIVNALNLCCYRNY